MFRKDTAGFRKVSGWVDGPRPLAPHRNSTGFRRRRRRRRRRTGSRQVRADGAGRQGRVGVSTLPPPHPAGRGVGMPRPGVSGRRAHRNTDRTTTRRKPASGCGTAGDGGGRCHQVLRKSPVVAVLRCGRGIPVRSHRTTVLLVRHRAVGPGCTLTDADLCPGHGAQSVAGPSPVGVGKPVGRRRCEHRRRGWSMVRQLPRSASVPPRPRRSRAPPNGPPRPAPAGPATRRRRRESGRHRWRPPR